MEMWRTFYWPCLIPQPWIKLSHKLYIVIIDFLNVDGKSIKNCVGNHHQHWGNSHHQCCNPNIWCLHPMMTHANQQNTIQTTHKTWETTSTCKQSLFILWKTKPHNWCLFKKTCSTCGTRHNFYDCPRAKQKGKWGCLVLIETMKLNLNTSCIKNDPTLFSKPTPFFFAHRD